MEKITLSSIREKFPMYADVPDEQLLIGLRKKYYSDIPMGQFLNAIDFSEKYDPTKDMGTGELFLAGMGKSLVDLGRTAKRVGSMVGIGDYDEKSAQADAELDKPLMKTGAGMAGNIAGDIALTALPGYRAQKLATKGITGAASVLPKATAAITRGVAPYAGAAAAGAGIGAATTPENLSEGASVGALAGLGGELAGRAIAGTYNAGKAILDPMTKAGRERVLKRTLERYATDPTKVLAAASTPEQFVPGVTPTLAEATGDVGIAQLQRAAQSASPDVASSLAESRARQIAGYKGVLDDMAGNDGKRQFFDAARNASADELYSRARAEGLSMTPEVQASMDDLLTRPSIQQGVSEAQKRGLEKGLNIASPKGSVAGLETVLENLNGQIGKATTAGDKDLAKALMNTRDKLLGVLDEASPAFGEARRTYAAMSKPINQMDIAQSLRDTAIPALDDLSNGALARVNANRYAAALRNADKTAAKATGLRGAKMADVMEPGQMSQIEGIGKDMARYAASQEAGRVAGSPTAQYLAGQNVIRQFAGPLGLPQGAVDAAAGRILSSIVNLPYKLTAGQTEQLLAQVLTDPAVAARVMQTKDPRSLATLLQPYAAQVAIQSRTR